MCPLYGLEMAASVAGPHLDAAITTPRHKHGPTCKSSPVQTFLILVVYVMTPVESALSVCCNGFLQSCSEQGVVNSCRPTNKHQALLKAPCTCLMLIKMCASVSANARSVPVVPSARGLRPAIMRTTPWLWWAALTSHTSPLAAAFPAYCQPLLIIKARSNPNVHPTNPKLY